MAELNPIKAGTLWTVIAYSSERLDVGRAVNTKQGRPTKTLTYQLAEIYAEEFSKNILDLDEKIRFAASLLYSQDRELAVSRSL